MIKNITEESFVDQIGYEFSDDGKIIRVEFKHADGTVFHINFRTAQIADYIIHLENASGIAHDIQNAEEQKKGRYTVKFSEAKTLIKISKEPRIDKRMVLTLLFDSGLRINIGLDQMVVSELVSLLNESEKTPILSSSLLN